jgi:predicted transcriptional regulator
MSAPWRGSIGRNAALVRALRLLRILADGRHHPVTELARDLSCHRRTIYRDVRALTEAGFIVDETGHRVRNGGRVGLLHPTDVFYLRKRFSDGERIAS